MALWIPFSSFKGRKKRFGFEPRRTSLTCRIIIGFRGHRHLLVPAEGERLKCRGKARKEDTGDQAECVLKQVLCPLLIIVESDRIFSED